MGPTEPRAHSQANDVTPLSSRRAPSPDRDAFFAHLERLRILTLRALARARPERAPAVSDAELESQEPAPAAQHGTRGRRLGERLGLDADELGLLWFAVAISSDPLLGPHIVALGGSEARRGVSLALYAAVTCLPAQRVRVLSLKLGPSHPLFRYALLETAERDAVPALAPLRAPPRVCRHLAGDDTLDEAVAAAGGLIALPELAAPTADEGRADAVLERTLASPVATVVVVRGPEGVGRRTAIARAARALGREAVALDVRRLATASAIDAALAGLRRECLLRDAVPVVAGVEDLGEGEPEARARLAAVQRFVDDLDGAAALVTTGEEIPVAAAGPVVRVWIPVPPASVRHAVWNAALGSDGPTLAGSLEPMAVRYRMGVGGIGAAVAAARAAARARGGAFEAGDLVEGVRSTVGHRFGDLARRMDIPHSWDDLVIPDDVREQIDLLTARAQHAYEVLETWGFGTRLPRGAGLAVLLSGPPGTGKTMIAGLLARALDLDLYQVDLSRVVSKWVGETEKNLSRVLDAADAGHALLLFDEADSLFAKRTEVRGANDRYANLEVNHLLQRIEAIGGVVVLTTNLEASLDPALKRRLAAHIVVPKPGHEERAALWGRLMTQRAPLARGVDFHKLAAQFPDLTGGNIRNAVVSAAFLAANEVSVIRQDHLERAAWNEYRSMGRICFQPKGNAGKERH